MKTNNFPITDLTEKSLRDFLNAQANVLLIGGRGCGKTARIADIFDAEKVKYVKFSGPTMDPWIDFIGVPTDDGKGSLKFLRPSRINSKLEAIFIDEINRAPLEVQDAVLELIQFKTINGVKFPNLKVVWAAINPEKDEDSDEEDIEYNVSKMDPALIDRFEVIVRLKDEPCSKWFKKKYQDQGTAIVDWWNKQPKTFKKEVSARRLDYALSLHSKNIAFKYTLPSSGNLEDLMVRLASDPGKRAFADLTECPSKENYEKLVKTGDSDYIRKTFEIDELRPYTFLAPKEVISDLFLKNEEYMLFLMDRLYQGFPDYKDNFHSIIDEIVKAHPDHSFVKKALNRKQQALANEKLNPHALNFADWQKDNSKRNASKKLSSNRDAFVKWAEKTITTDYNKILGKEEIFFEWVNSLVFYPSNQLRKERMENSSIHKGIDKIIYYMSDKLFDKVELDTINHLERAGFARAPF